jgi:hypothetical protein
MKADGNTHSGCTREMFRDKFQVSQILHTGQEEVLIGRWVGAGKG